MCAECILYDNHNPLGRRKCIIILLRLPQVGIAVPGNRGHFDNITILLLLRHGTVVNDII